MRSTPTVADQMSVVDRELHDALMGTTKWNETRIPVIRGTFNRLLNKVTLLTSADTRSPILEIGSDGQLASAKVLHALTGLDVVASNLTVKGLEDRVGDYPIRIHQNEVGSLDFPDNSFSMLFGRAVLEHISDLDEFLIECDRVLEPGGVIYLDGGPLFYSPRGHHMAVRGPSGTHYGFASMPDLLPNWCQLESNEDELFVHLTENTAIDHADARVIAHYVFTSPEQNRLSATQVMDAFERSPFSDLAYDTMHMKKIVPPAHLVEKYGEFDLTCNGLAYYLKKATDIDETQSGASSADAAAVPRGLASRVVSRLRRLLAAS